jgi:DNA-binding transcriptional LysR family regulator
MEIQQLRHLLAAVDNKNLLRASEKSFISQSGLSRSIKNLEHRLGVPMLIRGPKGVEPTIYGLTVLRRAKIILNEVARSIEEVKALEQGRIGEVTFGITQNYATYIVPPILAAIHAECPALKVTVVADGFVELLARVKSETIDFGFGLIGAIHHSDGVTIEPLRAHRSRVFASASHPLASAAGVSNEDLANVQWAMLNSESVQRGFWLFFESRGMTMPVQMLRSNSIALIRQMVIDTDALTILPQEVVQPDLDAGRLVAISCNTPVERTHVGLFFRKDGLLTPQAELVAQHLREATLASDPATHCHTNPGPEG